LNFIQNTLGFGQILFNDGRNAAYFRVQSRVDIKKIIDIFSYHPLNSSKHLNFLDFKKAFEIYTNTKSKSEAESKINNLINNMNNLRSDYSAPKALDHEIKITPY